MARPKITPFQRRVYTLLLQIPAGQVTTYAGLSRALSKLYPDSPTPAARAIGQAMAHNPFAPEVPCHRVISTSGYVGGFKGDWEAAPSGVNQQMKVEMLKGEGVEFDERGMMGRKDRELVLYAGPWKTGKEEVERLEQVMREKANESQNEELRKMQMRMGVTGERKKDRYRVSKVKA